MSQAKVDKYKEYKANKKQNIKKEQSKKRMEYIIGALILAAFVGVIGYGVGTGVVDRVVNGESTYTELDVTEINNYLSSISE